MAFAKKVIFIWSAHVMVTSEWWDSKWKRNKIIMWDAFPPLIYVITKTQTVNTEWLNKVDKHDRVTQNDVLCQIFSLWNRCTERTLSLAGILLKKLYCEHFQTKSVRASESFGTLHTTLSFITLIKRYEDHILFD